MRKGGINSYNSSNPVKSGINPIEGLIWVWIGLIREVLPIPLVQPAIGITRLTDLSFLGRVKSICKKGLASKLSNFLGKAEVCLGWWLVAALASRSHKKGCPMMSQWLYGVGHVFSQTDNRSIVGLCYIALNKHCVIEYTLYNHKIIYIVIYTIIYTVHINMFDDTFRVPPREDNCLNREWLIWTLCALCQCLDVNHTYMFCLAFL